MSLSSQMLPLVGVVVGAAVAFVAVRIAWKRARRPSPWDEHRSKTYAAYLHVAKQLANRYERIAAARGMVTGPEPLEPTPEVLAELDTMEARHSALSETVRLIGGAETRAAATELDDCLQCLQHLARAGSNRAKESWDQAYAKLREAGRQYIEYARASLGVTGEVGRDAEWPEG
ncbi:hypothetical protein ACTPOK_20270 [Streptomyces inhibens]|uniref:hypothetical protein n=1 Tax=Streptomyces inhibens TaxID=2293571 RepID=UPI00402AD143